VAVGLGPIDNREARGGEGQYQAVEAIAEYCFDVPNPLPKNSTSTVDLNWFWGSVGSGPFPSADDVCSCWSRSVAGVRNCTQDMAYDVCMILTGNAPVGRPPWSYAGTPHPNYILGCAY
jgi:hypothetical protein